MDVDLQDLDAAELASASIERMKLFTLDRLLILRKSGSLAQSDRISVWQALLSHLPHAEGQDCLRKNPAACRALLQLLNK